MNYIYSIYKTIKFLYWKTVPKSNNWVKVKSWRHATEISTGYDNNIILQKCLTSLLKVKNGDAVYERDSVLFDKIQYSWTLLAFLLKVSLEKDGCLSLIDFGGSLGSSYFQNKEFLSDIKVLDWNIVEQEIFVKTGNEYFKNKELKFYNTIQEILELKNPNLIILSGVLQYLEKPLELLNELNTSGIKYLIFDRTSFIENSNSIITIQKVNRSIYNESYPTWFFSENFIPDALYNYDLITSFNSYCDPNYFINFKQCNWKGFVYKIKNKSV